MASDDLRARIAAAMRDNEYGVDDENRLECAEMLIRELGLRQEFSIGDDEGGRVLWLDGEDPITPRDGEIVETRWITEWTTNE